MNNQTPQTWWAPKSYPIQTWTGDTPHINVSEPVEKVPPIPTAIRAVKDSQSPKSGRTLVICLDGTGDQFDNDNSNVVKLIACLKKDDPNQLTYYQSGIGTYNGHGGLQKGVSAGFDMALGSGLGIHIKDAYSFLMQNYIEGDRICLFGFSRGSYTVRCLAGMLHKVGLLPAHNQAQISFAYRMYKDDTPNGSTMSAEFKKTFSQDVTVYFIGVWDCVASVGFIPRMLPFSKSATNTIGYFRHAMALDEHRAKFEVCQWQQQDPGADHDVIDNTPQAKFKARIKRIKRSFSSSGHSSKADKASHTNGAQAPSPSQSEKVGNAELDNQQDKPALETRVTTNVKEVWFMGCHADVGGGAVPNNERHMLSRIPLRWMIRQCFECETGILFTTAALAESGIDVGSVWPVYQIPKKPVVGPSPMMLERYEKGQLPGLEKRSAALGVEDPTGSGTPMNNEEIEILPEQVEDHFDGLASINDQLVQAHGWWILEFWPVKIRVLRKLKEGEKWEKVVGMNLGRHRAIRELEPSMHWTVQMRINEKKYKVKTRVDPEVSWGVVT
ncbi:hypothetical protein N431DRAFT_418257 [Stipitochalara longipes BDJ]|nr:hypothetical protein N431DRAFT_418257 [Stipitochalara longipes BDJ]